MSKQVKKPAELTPVKISNVTLLPSNLATEPNKKMLDSTLDVMTSKGQLLPFKETLGIRSASNKVEEFFNVESDQVRRESQGNNMLVLNDVAGNYLGKVSYYDIENYFAVKGNELKDGVTLDKNVNVLDLPVDPIKLTDYSSYYWLSSDLPPCQIHLNAAQGGGQKFSIADDLIGKPFATLTDDITGRSLELQNGMALFFTGTIDSYYKTDTDTSRNLTETPVIFYVYGVGDSIGLFPKTSIEQRSPFVGLQKRPWDKYGDIVYYVEHSWDGEVWDGSEINENDFEYVVQEKYTTNTNHWQAVDRWYHISTIRAVSKFLNVNIADFVKTVNKAVRPIISFRKDVKLHNWPTGANTEIHALLPKTKATWEGKKHIADQFGYELQDDDLVVFSATPGIWRINNLLTGATFTQVGTAVAGDGAIIVAPGVSEYYRVIYKNSKWQLAQNKTTKNQTPLFEFYTSDNTNLESFNETTFDGGIILGFQEGDTFDPVLQKNVKVNLVESESGVTLVTPNQLNFVTGIDVSFEYTDSATNDSIAIVGPFGYKSKDNILPFYKNRNGLDFTKQVQDLLYAQGEAGPWSAEIIPITNGFNTIHVYHDDVDQCKFYFDVDGYGLLRFSSKTGDDVLEQVMPLVSGSKMKIVCHDLPYPITFYKTSVVSNITKPQAITSEYITNNGISNGIIEIDLNEGVIVNEEYINNELAVEDTRILWKFGNTYKTAYVKPLNKWTFLQSVFTKDYTNPLYNGYDYSVTDITASGAGISYYKLLTEEAGISTKVQTGDKVCVSSILQKPSSKTAPLSLTVNPLNEALSEINYYSLFQHGSSIKTSSTNIKKFSDPNAGVPTLLMGGGTILKHSDPLAKTAIVATNLPYDLGDLLIKQGKHYDSFLHKLKSEIDYVINTVNYTQYSSLEVLNLALNRIYVVTPSDDLFWNHSNMIGWTNTISQSDYIQSDITVGSTNKFSLTNASYTFENISHGAGKESILHIEYNNKLLVRGYDYWFNSTGDYYTEIEFRSFFTGKIVTITQWYTTFKSLVPASLAKIGLAPAYQPEILEDVTLPGNYFMFRHDGTRYYLKDGVDGNLYPSNLTDQYLWEYEKAVWSSISYDVENNSYSEILEGQPGYFRTKAHTWNQSRQTIINELRQWMLENDIFVMANDKYDDTNGFTLKYQLGSGDGEYLVGSYKALYRYMYDTDRPHTHPWEMLGYTIKPTWWDTHYSWTDNTKRVALKKALRIGKISNPAEDDVVNPAFARNFDITNTNPNALEDFPVDSLGKLIAPNDFAEGLLASSILFSIDTFSEDESWEAGNIGPYEEVFLSTQRGLAALSRAHYLLAPSQYVNSNWVPGQTIKNAWGHKLDKTTNFWQQGTIEHNYHRETVNGELVYTSGIESLYAEFCVLNNKDYASEVNDKFSNVAVNKEFLLRGFTNKNNIRIQSTSIGSQKSILFIPEENYQVRTVKHYPEREIFYSGMRVIFDGSTYSLNGFAYELGYFPYFIPKEGSTTTPIQIDTVVIKQKNSYTTNVGYVQYGQQFSSKQEVYDILIGYGKYLENMGIVYDEAEGGDVRNWQLSAKQFIFWSNSHWAPGNYIDLNPNADSIKITGQYGQLENLEGTNENVGQCVDRFNKPLFSKDLLVSRDADTILIKTKKSGTGIYGIKLAFVNYETVVHLQSTSIFGDVYYNPSQSTGKRSFILGGKKSINWTGSYYVPGYAFSNDTLIPNFDSMSDLGRNLLDVESTILDTTILDASRAQFGLNRNPELRQLFLDDGNEVLFKNAITYNKGTTQVFNSLNPLTHQDGSKTAAYEEYMIRLGEFGNTKNIEYYEFELLSSDIDNDAQIIKFTPRVGTDFNSLYITHDSNRWVHKPYKKELYFTELDKHSTLKKSGPIITGDTDFIVDSLEDLSSIYNEFIDLWSIPAYSETEFYKINDKVRYQGQLYIAIEAVSPGTATSNASKFTAIDEPYLPNIFVNNYNKPNINLAGTASREYTPGTWQVLQTMDNNLSIVEVCTGLTDTSKARITTSAAHNLTVGDYVCIVNAENGATNSVNGLWKVIELEQGSTTQFYIETRILKTIYGGKVFPLRPVRFENQANYEAAIAPSSYYKWKQKYTTEKPLSPSGYDLRYPIAIVDDGKNKEDPVTFNYGNYKVYHLQPDNTVDVVKQETWPIDIDNIEQLIVYDYAANKTVAKLELFSPQNLVIPEVFKNDIDSISRVDPAKYNRTTDKFKSIYTSLGWYEEYVGRRWWNTNSTQFNDYTTADDQVKAEYWGTTTTGANPEIYEWTKSNVHPSQWAKLVLNSVVVFDQVATGEAYVDSSLGVDNYHWVEEQDYVNGNTYTVYYFWVKNKKTIAQESKFARTYTVDQLSKVVLNPSAAGLAWWSPISVNAILVKGIKQYLNNSSTVVQIKKKTKGEEKHQQWIFISEGNTVETIPQWLHVRLRDSISGHIFERATALFTNYSPTAVYERYSIVKYNEKFYISTVYWYDPVPDVAGYTAPVAGAFNASKWYELTSVVQLTAPTTQKPGKIYFYKEKSVPNIFNLHRYNLVGNSIRPYVQTWFNDLYEARRTFVKRLNEILLHVDIVDIPNWETSILKNIAYLAGDARIDMTKYWTVADYSSEDFDTTKSVDTVLDDITELYSQTYTIGDYIKINDSTDPRKYAIYRKTDSGGFDVVFRKDGTIQITVEFETYGWDSAVWDSVKVPWDYDINSVFNGIMEAIRYEIFVGKYLKYYSSIMCTMFRYVLSEQVNVDWIAKASTVEPVNLISQTLSNNDYIRRDEIGAITDFYSSVKSYRDKIRGGTITKVAIETAKVTFSEQFEWDDITDADNVASGSIDVPLTITVDEPVVE